jgi:hypothetical protein
MTQHEPKRCYRCDRSLGTPITAVVGGPASGRLNDYYGICELCKADLAAARPPSPEPAELTKLLKRE